MLVSLQAYATALGQIGVLVALGLIALCWVWASTMLRLPTEERVFRGRGERT